MARRKRGSQQKILESADLTTLLNSRLSQASIAKKLGVYASALSYYLKKRRREHEGGAEGDGEGDGGEEAWGSLEDEYLRKTLANEDGPRTSPEVHWITDQLPGRDADAVRRRMCELQKEAEAARCAEVAPTTAEVSVAVGVCVRVLL